MPSRRLSQRIRRTARERFGWTELHGARDVSVLFDDVGHKLLALDVVEERPVLVEAPAEDGGGR